MSTLPPGDQQGTQPSGTSVTSGPAWGNMPDMARLPIPGNAEFAVYVVALILAQFGAGRLVDDVLRNDFA